MHVKALSGLKLTTYEVIMQLPGPSPSLCCVPAHLHTNAWMELTNSTIITLYTITTFPSGFKALNFAQWKNTKSVWNTDKYFRTYEGNFEVFFKLTRTSSLFFTTFSPLTTSSVHPVQGKSSAGLLMCIWGPMSIISVQINQEPK